MIVLLFCVCYILPVKLTTIHKEQEDARTIQARQAERQEVRAGDAERAAEVRDEAQKFYDKAATKNVIHQNKAARKTSRLDKALAGSKGE
jgi:ribosomal protein S20